MSEKKKQYEIVSKSTCQYPQAENFVSAKQLLIITENDKRYLLVKLVNNRTEPVTGATLLVEQFNDLGEKIAAESVRVDGFTGYPKKPFAVETKIPVAPTCIDCRVIVVDAEFGKFVYSSGNEEELPKYRMADEVVEPAVPANILKKAGKKGVAVEPRSLKMPMTVLIISLALLVAAFVAIWIYTTRFVATEDKFLHDGVYYAFVGGDRSEGSDIYVTGVRGGRSEITVPASIDGHGVVRVGKSAFAGNKNIKKVNLVGEIEVDAMAFYGCTALESITFKNVTAIADYAFTGCTALKSVELSNASVIGEGAFSGCNRLKSLTISGDDKLSLGYGAFANCSALRTIEIDREIDYGTTSASYAIFGNSTAVTELYLKNFECGEEYTIASLFKGVPKLATLVIDEIDTIGAGLCESFTSLTTVRFNTVISPVVGERAFNGCEKLTEAVLPSQVKSVGYAAFYGTAIKSFDGSALVSLADEAFAECKSLAAFSLEKNTELEEIGTAAFKNCLELKTITIPSGVVLLGAETFSGCESLASVNFADDSSIEVISQSAFENCVKLVSVNLPSGVTTLSTRAFSGCVSMTEIVLPDGLVTIGQEVFAGTGLTEITIPDSVQSIARGAFNGCEGLQNITVPFVGGSRVANMYLSYLFGAKSATAGETVPLSLKSVTVTNSDAVANNAFYGCSGITNIVYHDGLTTIGNNSFFGCSSLVAIDLGQELVSVGGSAFNGCEKLTELVLPDTVSYVGYNALGGCNSLAHLTAPFVGETREDNTYLAYMFGGSASDYDLIPTSLVKVEITDCEFIGAQAFYGTSVREIVLGDGVRYIYDEAFRNNRKLNVITLPKHLEYIGNYAFYGCYFLYEVFNFSEPLRDRIVVGSVTYGYVAYYALKVHLVDEPRLTVVSYDGYDFVENENMWYLVRYPEEQAEQILPSGESGVIIADGHSFTEYELRGRLFRDNSTVTSVYIPSNVNAVGVEAFYGCENLETATVEDGVNVICESAFSGCVSLKEFTFPSGIETVSDEVFSGCSSLETVVLPERVVAGNNDFTVGYRAFYGCSALTAITLPVGCTEVGDSAFYGCSALSAADLSTVTVIASDAFGYCSALTAVDVSDDCTTIGDRAFYYCYMLYDTDIPSSCTAIGNSAFFGCRRIKSVVLPSALGTIGDYAFYGCDKLYEVYNLTDRTMYPHSASNGYVTYYAYAVYTSFDVTPLDNIIVNDAHYYKLDGQWSLVDYYGDGALNVKGFTYNGETVDDITVIVGAFSDYTFITSATFAKEVTRIGANAFSRCASLESVSISAQTLTVGDDAFAFCDGLTSLYIGGSDVTLGASAFNGCTALKTAKLEGGNFEIDSGAFYGDALLVFTANCDNLTVFDRVFHSGLAEANIKCSDKFTAGNYTFNSSSFSKLTVYAYAVEIGAYNFTGYASEINITGTTSVTINANALYGCTVDQFTVTADALEMGSNSAQNSLTQIKMTGASSVNIKDSAFSNTAFEKMTIYGDTVTVGAYTFNASVSYEAEATVTGTTSVLIKNNAFYYAHMDKVNVKGGIVRISGYAFSNSYVYSDVVIAGDVTIDAYGIRSGYIENMELSGNVTLSADAFTYTSVGTLYIHSDNDVVIPRFIDYNSTIYALKVAGKNVTVNDNAFNGGIFSYYCLFAVDISADADLSIGQSAFYGQNYLESVKLTANNNAQIGESAFAANSDSGRIKTLVLPNGLKEIAEAAFFNCNSLTELTVPASVTSIGKRAFGNCFALEKLTLNNGVASIGESAFCNCNALLALTLPNSLTVINSYTFSGCVNLTELTVPSSVTVIGEQAFSGCNNLTKLSLPDGLESIGNSAFHGCFSLTELTIPNSVTSIGGYAFAGCYNITRLALSDRLVTIGYYAFGDCNALTELTVPNSVTSIGGYAFAWCDSLARLTLSNRLTSIGDYAFYNCGALTALAIPSSITSISSGTFYGCYALAELTIPNSVTSIGIGAFGGCSSLEKLSLPNKLESIGNDAFYNCNVLTELTVPSSVKQIGSYAFYNCNSLEKLTLSSGLTSISSYAFGGCNSLKELTVPSSVTAIYNDAFRACNKLEKLTLPVGLVSIGSYAFDGCYSLKELTVPSSVTTIYSDAFRDCYKLEKLTLPDNLSYIDSRAFYDCNSLGKIDIRGVGSIGEYAFYGCGSATAISVAGAERAYIYSNAFEGCSSLADLALVRVGYIGSNAFRGCAALKYIELPEQLNAVGDYAFYGATSLFAVYNNSNLNISVGRDETHYGGVAMYAAVVTKVKSEAELIYAQNDLYKFVGSKSGSVTTWYLYETGDGSLPDSVTVPTYGKIDKYVIKCRTFKNYVSSIVIPTSVVGIQNNAFASGAGRIYYKGTASAWENISGYSDVGYVGNNVYCYSSCVHSNYEWTYKDGSISTTMQKLTDWKTVTPATCSAPGKQERHCEGGCGKRNEEREIPIDPDAHDYQNGKCVHCHEPDPNAPKQTTIGVVYAYQNKKTRELEVND
ncbi:MAG: leucine-rich repeat protein [Clostridiales bacterium]|nr:leucine-rich repeat protein [Clostridiales bacterium]